MPTMQKKLLSVAGEEKMQQQLNNNVCFSLTKQCALKPKCFHLDVNQKNVSQFSERTEFSYFFMIFMMEIKCMLPKLYSTIEKFQCLSMENRAKKSHI